LAVVVRIDAKRRRREQDKEYIRRDYEER